MGPHRQKGRVTPPPARQAGITAIGFLFLAALIGIVGLGGIKVTPIYFEHMRLNRILDDVQRDLDGAGATPTSIRQALSRRFDVEGITLPRESVTINQVRNGYEVRVAHENRTPYIADIWLLVAFDKQVEIRR
jgi:hypothetical protein